MTEAEKMRELMTGPKLARDLALSEAVESGVLSTMAVYCGQKAPLGAMLAQLDMGAK